MNPTSKVVLSASRRTDIPAFYMPWFMERIKSGAVAKYRWILAPTIIIPAITIAYFATPIQLHDDSVVWSLLSIAVINVIAICIKLMESFLLYKSCLK